MNPPNESPLVDTHAHLDDARLRADLPSILDRAAREGVSQIIAIGTTAASSAGALELAGANWGIFASIGIQLGGIGGMAMVVITAMVTIMV